MPIESAITMVSPKQLEFCSSGVGVNSDDMYLFTSRRESPRNRSSKLPASDSAEPETETKKTDKKKKKKSKTPSNRIWNEEDELSILKGLVEYRAKTGHQDKTDWDVFYGSLGGSIIAKFAREQVLSKVRKLKRRYLGQLESMNQKNDPKFTRASDSEAFGYSVMIWGQEETGGVDKEQEHQLNENVVATETEEELLKENEGLHDNGAVMVTGEDMLKANEEEATDEGFNGNGAVMEIVEELLLKESQGEATDGPSTENGATNVMENGTQQSQSGEEMLKEQEKEATVEPLTETVTVNPTENRTTVEKEIHEAVDDELCGVKDAFETLISQGLSDYRKELQLEKLMSIGTGKRRELSDEWEAICVEERRLNIKKLRFSVKLAEAAIDN